jgi:hypothetical protein
MGCFEKLVSSKFLANVSQELDLARQTIVKMSQTNFPPQVLASKKKRKMLYNTYIHQYFLLEEMEETEFNDDPTTIYYLHLDHIILIYSFDVAQIRDAVKYAYNVNGEIPIYKTQHKLQDRTLHTVLFDARMTFQPASIN